MEIIIKEEEKTAGKPFKESAACIPEGYKDKTKKGQEQSACKEAVKAKHGPG